MCYMPMLPKANILATFVLDLSNVWSILLIGILFHASLVIIDGCMGPLS